MYPKMCKNNCGRYASIHIAKNAESYRTNSTNSKEDPGTWWRFSEPSVDKLCDICRLHEQEDDLPQIKQKTKNKTQEMRSYDALAERGL